MTPKIQSSQATLLTVAGLQIGLNAQSWAMVSADFELLAGEMVAVVGQSGVGKSLLARALQGLLDEGFWVSGTAILRDKDDQRGLKLPITDGKSVGWRAVRGRRLGYIYQEPKQSFSPVHSVKEHFKMVLSQMGIPKAQHHQQMMTALLQVKLPNPKQFLGRYAHQLSGGEAQRVAIALALISSPDVIIADEPTSSLDGDLSDEILALLRQLTLKHGMGVLIISHDGGVSRFADRVLTMTKKQGVAVLEPALSSDISPSLPTPYAVDPSARTVLTLKDFQVGHRTWFWGVDWLCHRLDVSLKQGQIIGLTGKSGIGKTTVAKAITRLDKHIVSRGEIWLGDTNYLSVPNHKLRQFLPKIIYLPQEVSASLNPHMRIIDSVSEGLKARHQQVDDQAIADIFAEFGLSFELSQRYPHELSGGEKQRICLIRAIIMRPDVLILDEPTAMLDGQSTWQVVCWLKNIAQEHRVGVLLLSHDKAVVQALCHQVIELA